jgi:hypothetical protein
MLDVSFSLDVDGERICCKTGDLATNQWLKFLNLLMEYKTAVSNASPNYSTQINDITNTQRTIVSGYNNGSNNVIWNFSGNSTQLGALVAIGNGNGSTVTPARTDVALANALASGGVDTPSFSGGDVVFSKAIVNNTGSTWTVREVGLYIRLQGYGDLARDFLMFHDGVSPAVTVNNGQTITVNYTFTFP